MLLFLVRGRQTIGVKMKDKILVTDSVFIFDENIRQMEDAGYSVERLDEVCASEEALCAAIKGKSGYILGGIEKVTPAVLKAADKLKVISFTGSGYTEKIVAHKEATAMGIAITATLGANASAVAEFALAYILMATRKIPTLTAIGGSPFLTTKSASETVLGIIGYGSIGKLVAQMADDLGYSVLISARKKIDDLPNRFRQVDLATLCTDSDIVTIHVDKINGQKVLDASLIGKMRKGSTIVNAAFSSALNVDAALSRVYSGDIYLYLDEPISFDSKKIPLGHLTQTNGQSGFNTFGANKNVSDNATRSLLNILETGDDEYKVN